MLFGRRRSSGLVRREPVCRLRRSVAYGRLGPRVIVTPVLRCRGCTGLSGSMAVVCVLGLACCSRLRSFRLAPHMNAQARAQTRRGQSSLGHGNLLLDLGQLLRAHTFDGFDSLAIRRDRRRCNNPHRRRTRCARHPSPRPPPSYRRYPRPRRKRAGLSDLSNVIDKQGRPLRLGPNFTVGTLSRDTYSRMVSGKAATVASHFSSMDRLSDAAGEVTG